MVTFILHRLYGEQLPPHFEIKSVISLLSSFRPELSCGRLFFSAQNNMTKCINKCTEEISEISEISPELGRGLNHILKIIKIAFIPVVVLSVKNDPSLPDIQHANPLHLLI